MRALLLVAVLGSLAHGSPVSEPVAAPAPAPVAAAEAAAEAHYGHYGYGRSVVLPTVWGASYGHPWGRGRRDAMGTRAKRDAAALPDPEPVADPNPKPDAHYGYYGYGYGYAPYYGYSWPYYGRYW